MNIRLLLLSFSLCIFFSNLHAQSYQSIKAFDTRSDIGISISNNSLGLDYRKHWKDNKYFRISNSRIDFIGNLTRDFYQLSSTINFGIENRKALGSKWWLSHGSEAGIYYSLQFSNRVRTRGQLSYGYFCGINYNLIDRITIGAEIKPYMHATTTTSIAGGLDDITFGTNASTKINLSYRF